MAKKNNNIEKVQDAAELNIQGNVISVKEYAETRHKTRQAVLQQMKRQTNAEKLKGHVFDDVVQGRNMKMLDEVAVQILDDASKNQTVRVVVDDDEKDARIKELEHQVQQLQAQKDEMYSMFNETLSTLTQSNAKLIETNNTMQQQILALEDKAAQEKNKTFFQRVFNK